MFALGCIQARACHTDRCPTGVTTQDAVRQRALVVEDKAERVFRFHQSTMKALAEVVAAAGLDHPHQFALHHFMQRVSTDRAVSFARVYSPLAPRALLAGTDDPRFATAWLLAQAESFAPTAAPTERQAAPPAAQPT